MELKKTTNGYQLLKLDWDNNLSVLVGANNMRPEMILKKYFDISYGALYDEALKLINDKYQNNLFEYADIK